MAEFLRIKLKPLDKVTQCPASKFWGLKVFGKQVCWDLPSGGLLFKLVGLGKPILQC